MLIINLNEKPLLSIPSVSVAARGAGIEEKHIPVLWGIVDQLPDELDALLITADLQAYDSLDKPVYARRLLGHIVAQEMSTMAEFGLIPAAQRTGVILAGDFYALPELNRRGGLGDVEEIWCDFAQDFRWVVGVAGNHDQFKGKCDFANVFRRWTNIYPLDGDFINLDNLGIAGISGVLGKPEKPWRHSPKEWNRKSQRLLTQAPDILVLHEGPDIPEARLAGRKEVRSVLNTVKTQTVVICGHCYWKSPVVSLSERVQVLNVDSRVVLLTRENGLKAWE
jgi:Icc protein